MRADNRRSALRLAHPPRCAIDRMQTAWLLIALKIFDRRLVAPIVVPSRPPQGARREALHEQVGIGVLRVALQATPGGLRNTALTTKGGREGSSREIRDRDARSRLGQGPKAENRRGGAPRGEHPRGCRRLARACGPTRPVTGCLAGTRAPIGAPLPRSREGTYSNLGGHLPRENDDACADNTPPSFRGASGARGPGIHTPQRWLWIPGSRHTQVGYSRLGHIKSPISGKPEIGGAPRNDGERCCDASLPQLFMEPYVV